MAFSKFEHVKISAISTVVPEKEINIYDEIHFYGNDIKKIDRMHKSLGFHKRRVADSGVTSSDLGIFAAQRLIQDMNLDVSSIDALMYVCQRPDFQSPATAFFIHNKLGLSEDCVAFDINQGCPGWVYGLWLSSQMLESGTCKKILLIVADTPSLGFNPEHRAITPLFGDAGTATLLEYAEKSITSYYSIETHSKNYEAIIHPVGHSRCQFNYTYNTEDFELFKKMCENQINTIHGYKASVLDMYMDGAAVFDFTLSIVPNNIKKLMQYAKKECNAFKALCLHQANKQIIKTVGELAGFDDDKVPSFVFENYGNNTMCSIPTTLNSVYYEDIISQKNLFLCSGFGNGLTCASAIIELDTIYSSGMITYIKPDDFMSRDEYIAYWENKLKGGNTHD